MPTEAAFEGTIAALVPRSAAFVGTMSALVPAGAAFVGTMSALVPTGAAFAGAMPALVPAGAAFVGTGAALVPSAGSFVPKATPAPLAAKRPKCYPARRAGHCLVIRQGVIMDKSGLTLVALVMVFLVSGCFSSNDPPPPRRVMPSSITVTVDAEGRLAAQGYTLAPADLAAFAKDVGGRPVVIVPKGNPSYGKAVQAREQLKAAGVSNVLLGDQGG